MKKKTKFKIQKHLNEIWELASVSREKRWNNFIKLFLFILSLMITFVVARLEVPDGDTSLLLIKLFILFYMLKFIFMDIKFDGIFNIVYFFGIVFLITGQSILVPIGIIIACSFVIIDLLLLLFNKKTKNGGIRKWKNKKN